MLFDQSVIFGNHLSLILLALNTATFTESQFSTESGGNKHPTSLQEDQFKKDFGISADVNLSIQEVPRINTFKTNNRVYGLNGEEFDVFSPHATFTHNGVEGEKPSSHLVQYEDEEERLMTITKDKKGETKSIFIVGKDGVVEELVNIVPGYLVTIKGEDFDREKLKSEISFGEVNKPPDYEVQPIYPTRNQNGTCKEYKILELAVVYDSSFCEHYRPAGATDQEAKEVADQKVASTIAEVSSRYQKNNFCMQILISHLEGYCDRVEDPYRDMVAKENTGCRGDDKSGLLNQFMLYWNTNREDVKRDAVQMLVGTSFECPSRCVVGCAKIASTCDNSRAYNVNHATYHRSSSITSMILAHQLAQNNGALEYNDGLGYIMDKNPTEGSNGFSLRSIGDMNGYLNKTSCLDTFVVGDSPTAAPFFTKTNAEGAGSSGCRHPFKGVMKFSPLVLLLVVFTYPYKQYKRMKERIREAKINPLPENAVVDTELDSESDMDQI